MTKKCSFLTKKLTVSVIILMCSICFAAEQSKTSKWVIAAEQFVSTQNKDDSISNTLVSVIPIEILDKLGNSLYRTVSADESYERKTYNLKNERISLFLQLSNQIKKRDALFLENYSQKELKKHLEDEEKKIQEIKDKLEENLLEQKNIKEELLFSQDNQKQQKNVIVDEKEDKFKKTYEEYKSFFKSVFTNDNEEIIEKISIYGQNDSNGDTKLYKTPEIKEETGYSSKDFEKVLVNDKINGLLSGEITTYGDYLFVTVTLRVYPSGKILTTVSEVGTIDEINLIAESIAQQITPEITNALPLSIYVKINPQEAAEKAIVYIDDVLHKNINDVITLDSGVHFIQILSENYNSVGTTYFFNGNQKYLVDVQMIPSVQGELFIKNENTIPGLFYQNGLPAIKVDEDKSQITINGEMILGQFIAENGESAFFYIPQNMLIENEVLSFNPKVINRSDYIEEKRKKMYNAYSILIVSLIPNFVAKGQAKVYGDNSLWKTASKATTYISIGCGGWFVYNLVRYFIAADSVIPEKPTSKNVDSKETKKHTKKEAKK